MDLRIKELKRKDYKKAIEFAIKGMHFDWYLDNKFLLNSYGRYFWYYELNRASHIYAAYKGDKFLGVLLAEVYGYEKKHNNFFEKIYVRLVDFLQKTFFKNGANRYEETTKKLLKDYLKTNTVDGEILFLAADPDSKVKGVGTFLLNALERDLKEKTIFLHTDDACTYQFYESRNFKRVKEKQISLEVPKGYIPLKCFIYIKKILG